MGREFFKLTGRWRYGITGGSTQTIRAPADWAVQWVGITTIATAQRAAFVMTYVCNNTRDGLSRYYVLQCVYLFIYFTPHSRIFQVLVYEGSETQLLSFWMEPFWKCHKTNRVKAFCVIVTNGVQSRKRVQAIQKCNKIELILIFVGYYLPLAEFKTLAYFLPSCCTMTLWMPTQTSP